MSGEDKSGERNARARTRLVVSCFLYACNVRQGIARLSEGVVLVWAYLVVFLEVCCRVGCATKMWDGSKMWCFPAEGTEGMSAVRGYVWYCYSHDCRKSGGVSGWIWRRVLERSACTPLKSSGGRVVSDADFCRCVLHVLRVRT